MRLIDADVLKHYATGGVTSVGILTCAEIDNAPTIDAVPVVRCAECKHWMKDVAGCTEFVGRCEWANYMVGAIGYCVYGERNDT